MKQNVLGMLGVTPVGGRFVTGLPRDNLVW